MAVTKTHPIKSTLKAAIDYILNPEKTDGKLLASSFGCGLETADIEFAWTREAAGDRGTHLGRHLIQSFAVGETTPEEAHKIGMELAGAVLGGKYEFVLTTHVDKDHLHNHLIFNAVSFVDYKKYHSNKQSYHFIRRTSDRICKEHGLSVVVPGQDKGRGLPDISLVEPLAQRLGISVAELLAGDIRANANRAGNMLKGVFYVCPICGNVVHALGEGSFSCCGSTMFPQEAEEPDADHAFSIERIEDDWYVTLDHPMTKDHYISFVAYATMDGICFKKLYPEQSVQPRFHITGRGRIYLYCNQHGLFTSLTPRK